MERRGYQIFMVKDNFIYYLKDLDFRYNFINNIDKDLNKY
jgi:hypothetical protein